MSTVTKPMALDETLQSTNNVLGSLGKDTTLQAIATAIANVGLSNIGNLSSLATTDKTSLVSAINEVVGDVSDLDTDKADKVASATNGNLAGLNASGNLTDSGWASDKTTTSASGNPISITGLKSNQLAVNPVITFEPIQAGSGDPSPSNVRAISGYDKIEVLSCGKNIWNDDVVSGQSQMSRNGRTYANTITDSRNYVNLRVVLLNGSTFVRQAVINNNITTAGRYSGVIGVASGEKVTTIVLGHSGSSKDIGVSYTLQAPITKVCTLAVSVDVTSANPSTAGGFVMKDIQLEENTSATTYTPINKITDISEPLPQTVYSGSLNVRTGVLTVDRTIVDLGDLSWTYASTYARFAATISNMSANRLLLNWLCSCYVTGVEAYKDSDRTDNVITIQGSTVYVRDSRYNGATAFTTAVTGQKLVYPLATPIEIQLTPHEISLLKDYAYVSTNGTNIALDYHNGEIATLGDVAQLGETVNKLGDIVGKLTDEEPYGFIEHMSILDPAQRIEYIGKNKNYKPVTVNLAGDHLANYNDWHDFFVLKENKPYMVKSDGTVDYALDPNDYTKKFDGTASDIADTTYTGGAFSWIPKIYKYEYVKGNDRYVYLSQKKLNDNYEAIGFIDENGLKHDGVWLPMFYGTEITQDGTVKIMSLATGTPSQSRDTATQKTYIENFSSQAKFFGGPIVNVLADLLIMLGKNSDIQAVFGTGNMSGGNSAQYMKANACLNGGAFYGTTTNNVLNKAFHSLVLLTQNQWQRDPYTLCYKGEYIVSPYYKYDLTGASYVNTGVFVTPPSSNNWVYPNKSVSVPHWGAIPVGPYSGSTTTGWADGQYTLATQLTDTTVRVVLRFGYCHIGRAGGVRCVDLDAAASNTAWNIGASPLLLSEGKNPV